MTEDMPDRTPDRMSERMPEGMLDKVPECLPEHMPEHIAEDMPGRMPEDMSDRMPEDLLVTKRIDVMVGITRSKVVNRQISSFKNVCAKYQVDMLTSILASTWLIYRI